MRLTYSSGKEKLLPRASYHFESYVNSRLVPDISSSRVGSSYNHGAQWESALLVGSYAIVPGPDRCSFGALDD